MPAILGYGVGAVGLGMGIGFLALHGSQNDNAESLGKDKPCPGAPETSCKAIADAQATANHSGNISTAGFIVGAVGVGAGTGLLIWAATAPHAHADDNAASTSRFSLSPGPGDLGLGLTGRF